MSKRQDKAERVNQEQRAAMAKFGTVNECTRFYEEERMGVNPLKGYITQYNALYQKSARTDEDIRNAEILEDCLGASVKSFLNTRPKVTQIWNALVALSNIMGTNVSCDTIILLEMIHCLRSNLLIQNFNSSSDIIRKIKATVRQAAVSLVSSYPPKNPEFANSENLALSIRACLALPLVCTYLQEMPLRAQYVSLLPDIFARYLGDEVQGSVSRLRTVVDQHMEWYLIGTANPITAGIHNILKTYNIFESGINDDQERQKILKFLTNYTIKEETSSSTSSFGIKAAASVPDSSLVTDAKPMPIVPDVKDSSSGESFDAKPYDLPEVPPSTSFGFGPSAPSVESDSTSSVEDSRVVPVVPELKPKRPAPRDFVSDDVFEIDKSEFLKAKPEPIYPSLTELPKPPRDFGIDLSSESTSDSKDPIKDEPPSLPTGPITAPFGDSRPVDAPKSEESPGILSSIVGLFTSASGAAASTTPTSEKVKSERRDDPPILKAESKSSSRELTLRDFGLDFSTDGTSDSLDPIKEEAPSLPPGPFDVSRRVDVPKTEPTGIISSIKGLFTSASDATRPSGSSMSESRDLSKSSLSPPRSLRYDRLTDAWDDFHIPHETKREIEDAREEEDVEYPSVVIGEYIPGSFTGAVSRPESSPARLYPDIPVTAGGLKRALDRFPSKPKSEAPVKTEPTTELRDVKREPAVDERSDCQKVFGEKSAEYLENAFQVYRRSSYSKERQWKVRACLEELIIAELETECVDSSKQYTYKPELLGEFLKNVKEYYMRHEQDTPSGIFDIVERQLLLALHHSYNSGLQFEESVWFDLYEFGGHEMDVASLPSAERAAAIYARLMAEDVDDGGRVENMFMTLETYYKYSVLDPPNLKAILYHLDESIGQQVERIAGTTEYEGDLNKLLEAEIDGKALVRWCTPVFWLALKKAAARVGRTRAEHSNGLHRFASKLEFTLNTAVRTVDSGTTRGFRSMPRDKVARLKTYMERPETLMRTIQMAKNDPKTTDPRVVEDVNDLIRIIKSELRRDWLSTARIVVQARCDESVEILKVDYHTMNRIFVAFKDNVEEDKEILSKCVDRWFEQFELKVEPALIVSKYVPLAGPKAIEKYTRDIPGVRDEIITKIEKDEIRKVFSKPPKTMSEEIRNDTLEAICVDKLVGDSRAMAEEIASAPGPIVTRALKQFDRYPDKVRYVEDVVLSPNRKALVRKDLDDRRTHPIIREIYREIIKHLCKNQKVVSPAAQEKTRVRNAVKAVKVNPGKLDEVINELPKPPPRRPKSEEDVVEVLTTPAQTSDDQVIREIVLRVATINVLENPRLAGHLVAAASSNTVRAQLKSVDNRIANIILKIFYSRDPASMVQRFLMSPEVEDEVKYVLHKIAIDMVTPFYHGRIATKGLQDISKYDDQRTAYRRLFFTNKKSIPKHR